jgi:hypothetical protein
VGVHMTMMDDKIADIGNPRESVGKHEDPISLFMFGVGEQRVSQQQQRTPQAQPPKCRWHHHLFLLFRRVPLHKETREKNGVAQPADNFPPSEISVVPKQPMEPIHHYRGLRTNQSRLTIQFSATLVIIILKRTHCSAINFATLFSKPSVPFISRRSPFLSTSHSVGIC